MTRDELIALRRERGKQELNIGDRVKVYAQDDGEVLYGGRTFEITGKGKCNGEFIYSLHGLMSPFTAEILELVKEPTDEIKCGDIVKVKADAPDNGWSIEAINVNPNCYKFLPFEVVQIEKIGLKTMAYADSLDGFMHICIPTCYLEPYYSAEDVRRMEDEQNKRAAEYLREHSGKDTNNPVKDIADVVEECRKGFAKITSELAEIDWQHYRAELASKIAVAYAEKGRYKPSEIGEFAVMVANDVVDNLKKQSE